MLTKYICFAENLMLESKSFVIYKPLTRIAQSLSSNTIILRSKHLQALFHNYLQPKLMSRTS